ncbi:MAG: hypothetical protein ACKVOI_11280 [Dongiaceae bacterium]
MNDNRDQPQKKPSREQREAAALRQNLARRKAQQRSRDAGAEDAAEAPAAGDSAGPTEKQRC